MGVYAGPDVSESGLVLALDIGNTKGYNKTQNIVRYSEDFGDATWVKSNCSVITNDIIAPDGTLTADRITATVNDDVIVSNTYTSTYNSTPLTYSIFAKAGTYRYIAIQSFVNIWSKTLVFDLQTGTALTPFYPNDGRTWSIVQYPNGWYRCIVTYPANYYFYYHFQFALTNYVGPADAGISSTTSPNVGEYIYVWGAQLETGVTDAGEYFTTTSTSKDRSTTWTDLSGRGNTGTLTNGPTYSSSNGGSLVFDGTDDYVTAPNTSLIHRTSNWTYSCWVNFSGTPSLGTIFENGSWTNCLLIRFETNGITIYSMSSFWGKFNLTPTLGIWYKLDFVRNGNNIDFYLNGSYSQSIAFTADVIPSSNLFIGMSQHAAGQCFNGRITNASIYNRALTAAEIQQNFNSFRGRFGI